MHKFKDILCKSLCIWKSSCAGSGKSKTQSMVNEAMKHFIEAHAAVMVHILKQWCFHSVSVRKGQWIWADLQNRLLYPGSCCCSINPLQCSLKPIAILSRQWQYYLWNMDYVNNLTSVWRCVKLNTSESSVDLFGFNMVIPLQTQPPHLSIGFNCIYHLTSQCNSFCWYFFLSHSNFSFHTYHNNFHPR